MTGMIKNSMFGGGRRFLGLLVIFAALAMVGCGSKEPTKKAPPKAPAAAKETAAPVEAVSQTEEATQKPADETVEYRYEPRGRRDPFRSVLATKKDKRNLADLPPLQRLELSDMQLSGIVWGALGYSALITTPDGKGYTVRTGTVLGPRGGVIKKITKSEIIIQETVEDIFGTKKTREIVKELHPQEEGKE